MKPFSFIMQYIKRYKFRYLAGIFTLFAVDAANVFIPRLTGAITDGLTARTIGWSSVRNYLFAIMLLGLTLAIGRFLWRYFLFGTARVIERELRNDMFAHLETMDVEYYNAHKTGDLMTRFTSDLNAVRLALGSAVICIFDSVVMTILVVFQMMRYVNVKLTLLALIPMVIICLGYMHYGRVLDNLYTERQDSVSNLADFVQESFSGIRVIKAFVRKQSEILSFGRKNQDTMDKSMKIAKLEAILIPLLDVIIGFSSLASLLYGGYLALMGDITLGRFVAFNQYVNMLVWPMLACSEAAVMFSQGTASIRRVQEILEADTAIKDSDLVEDPQQLSGHIRFSHLTFTHQGNSVPVLHDINLDVPSGTTLAIIGRTGNGKTTLVNLLLRLYNTDSGMIYLDEQDINTVPLKTLRENIAYVPQDNFLFSDTLKANIAFGSRSKDLNRVIAAAKSACIHDNIADFPESYDTVVGERGVTLSGGQKQRSSIARALMKNAPILILDDSLSAVDTDTEEHILHNLREDRAGKTTILIAHRISTVQHADLIMVLEDGEMKELGNHTQLIQKNGIYKEMFEKQQLEASIGEQEVAR